MSGLTYGPLKAAGERAVVSHFGADRTAVIRPTYVVGQVIEARDQARFALRLVEDGVSGAFHTCSPPPPWTMGDFVDCLAGTLDSSVDPVWAPAAWLLERDVDGGTFPLWAEGGDEGVMALDPSRAMAGGLSPRPLEDTVRDTWAWMRAGASWRRAGSGVGAEREQELLAQLDH